MTARIRHWITEVLLWILAVSGLAAIVMVICAYVFNVSIILFRTGSMEPTIPAGSAALVQEIPASEVEVGDVLTVDRPGQLPVTHRVTSVEPGDGPQERIITMQGDANDSEDPYPYTITEGRVLLASVPGLAQPLHQMNNPYVLGGLTLGASLLVGWAFWPRSRDTDDDAAADSQEPTATESTLTDEHRPRHGTRRAAGVSLIAVPVVSALVVAAPAEPAQAAPDQELVQETRSSQHITLTSVYDPGSRQNLAPGAVSVWDIGVAFDTPTRGDARVGLSSAGHLPLQVTVRRCAVEWSTPPGSTSTEPTDCPGGAAAAVADYVVSPEEEIAWIDEFSTDVEPWLRLDIQLPDDDQALQDSEAQLSIHVGAREDEASIGADVPGADASQEDDGPSAGETSPTGEAASADSSAVAGSGTAEREEQALARTGVSVLALLVAALASMLLGRWMMKRAG
ncbi:signal peptidase I [Nesterenkonia sp.]|uniref:signal peptidase I n=1 Tax=Nesterenkonia sp. TaxID=704201 RepID=UPI002614AE2A|nr:signal peptidase I [Nesterenkonia sp.]